MILPRAFYERDTVTVARDLVGQILIRRTQEGICAGRIVETEAYLGERDPAAHSYRGRTERVRVQFGPAGHAYVYLIYGMYWCLNFTSGPAGVPEVVLLRALEPISGLKLMSARRGTDRDTALCSGPGKLCRAMAVGREQYGADLCREQDGLWVEAGESLATDTSPRIGVDYAGEAAAWPLRFTARGSRFLSRPPGSSGDTHV